MYPTKLTYSEHRAIHRMLDHATPAQKRNLMRWQSMRLLVRKYRQELIEALELSAAAATRSPPRSLRPGARKSRPVKA